MATTTGVKISTLIFFICLSIELVSSSPVQAVQAVQAAEPATQVKSGQDSGQEFDYALQERALIPESIGSFSVLLERVFKQVIPEGISILQLVDFSIKQFVYLIWDILYQFPLTRPLMKFVYIGVGMLRLITDPFTALLNKFLGYFYNVMQLRTDAPSFSMLGRSAEENYDFPLNTKDFSVEAANQA